MKRDMYGVAQRINDVGSTLQIPSFQTAAGTFNDGEEALEALADDLFGATTALAELLGDHVAGADE